MSFFKHQGGKARSAARIVQLFPPHACYCEPFAGAASCLFAKERSDVEVVNDIDGDIVNTFRCVKLHADAVIQELHLAVNSRECFYECRAAKDLTDIQRAARFFYLRTLSFGADGRSYGVIRLLGSGASSNLGLSARPHPMASWPAARRQHRIQRLAQLHRALRFTPDLLLLRPTLRARENR